MPLGHVRIVGLELIEIAQLVQAENTELPQLLVVLLAFFQRDFAADDFIAGGCVALKLNTADEKLFSFVNINLEGNQFLFVVEVWSRNRRKVDISLCAVGFAQILQAFGNLLAAEDIAILDGKLGAQSFGVAHRLVVLEGDLFQAVLITFFNRNADVRGFTQAVLEQRNMKTLVAGVVDFHIRFLHDHLVVAPILELLAHMLGIFVEFGSVISLGKQALEEN